MNILVWFRVFILFATLFFEHILANTYNETLALNYIDFAGAAYCCGTLGSGCDDWSCPSCHRNLETVVIEDKSTNANGFVGYDADLNKIIISFAGTDPLSIRNWVVDIETEKVPFVRYGANASYVACYGDCKVHKGFYEAYLSVGQSVRDAVKRYQDKAPQPPAIITTGHSLGAALAQHAALDLSSTQEDSVESLYNYGQPRTGNSAFANFSANLLGGRTFRVTHHKDPVPQLPFERWGFHQEVLEVFYEAQAFKAGGFKLCTAGEGEDPSCSDKYAVDLNVVDHLTYMGFDFIANYLICKL